MSTWLELEEEILTMLDVDKDVSTSSDIRALVKIKLKRVRDRLYLMRPPYSLLVSASAATVSSTTTYISITGATSGANPGLSLTDFWRPFTVTIDGEDFEFVDWPVWVRQNNAVAGDQRLNKSFTINYENKITLSTYPVGSVTWSAVLHYLKQPATIIDAGTPEIGQEHEELLVLGVALQFPNLFQGEERTALYASIKADYNEHFRDFRRDTYRVLKKNMRLRPAVRKSTRSSVVWGSGETS